MDAEDPMRRLGAAVHQGDLVAILAELPAVQVMGGLQLGGDGLLLALDEDAPGAVETARSWVAALHERAWEGDAELAQQLEAWFGTRPPHGLKPLPVDLDELSIILEGDPLYGGGKIDLRTGEVWPQFAFDDGIAFDDEEDEDGVDDEERWLTVWCEGSRSGYRDMEIFADTFTNAGRRDRLEIALQGRGAFRRFKDVLARWPAEFTRWHAFSDERRRGRARAWLADAGYRVVPRGDRSAP